MKTLHRILCSILSLSFFAAVTHKVEAANVPGSVIAWGAGATNTGIDPEFGQSIIPSNLVGGTSAISGGLYHSVAVKNDGTVMSWGYNGYGQTTIPAGYTTVAAVASLPYTTVSGVVANFQPNPTVPGTVNTCTITVSPTVNIGLIMAAIVPGMTVTGPAGSVGAGAVITSKVTSGSVTTLTFSVSNVASDLVTASFTANLTFTAPVAWGSNLVAVTVTPTVNTNFSAASVLAGMFVTGPPGSIGANATVVNKTIIATTNPAGSVTILSLSVPHIFSPQGDINISITPGNPVIAVAAGGFHTLALRQDGTVVAWGAGGPTAANGTAPHLSQSIIPLGLTTLIGVAATIPRNDTGLVNTVTLSAANTGIVPGMLCTGPADTVGVGARVLSNSGTTVTLSVVNRNAPSTPTVPTILNFYSGVTRISAGYYHSVALRNDGSVVAWGDNTAGQTSIPVGFTTFAFSGTVPPNPTVPSTVNTITISANNTNIVPDMMVTGPPNTVGAGASILSKASAAGAAPFTLTLSVPNAINTNAGSISVPILYTPGVKVVAIGTGNEHTMALRADGSIVMWGRNVEGETSTSGLTPINANATLPATITTTVNIAAPVLPVTDPGNFKVTLTAANASIVPGMLVSGGTAGTIGSGATIVSKAADNVTLTLSVPNTNTAALVGINLTFSPQPTIAANANLAVGPTNTVTLTAINAAIVPGLSVAGIPGTVGIGATVLSKDVTGLILTLSVPNTNTAVVSATPLIFYTPTTPNNTVKLLAANPNNSLIVPGMYVTGPASTVGIGAMVLSKASDGLTLTLSTRNAYVGIADSASTQLTFSTGIKACAIAAGGDTSYALKPDATVAAWGDNFNGQTIIPSALTTSVAITAAANLAAPVAPESTPSNFIVTLATANPAIVPGMLVTGPVGTVGFGVGSGSIVISKAPDNVTLTLSHANVNTAALTGISLNFYTGVMKVRAGGEHADALKTDGTVTAWGKIWNGSGYVTENLPPGLTGVTDIATGAYHTLAIGNTPLAITIQPVSLTVTPGATATFFVGAPGATTWQWQKNGVNVPGATSSTLVLTNVQASDLADYRVIVGNGAGSVISNVATLSGMNSGTGNTFYPVIVTQPASLVVNAGGTASFIVEATNASGYQWYKDGTPIPGATGTSLSMTNVQTANAGSYKVVVSNSAGTSVTSNAAILTVAYIPPTITSQPVSVAAMQGQTVTFNVTATGSAPLIYQWMKNGVPIPSATTATLTLSDVQASDADTYTVMITNPAGSVTSNPVTLTLVFAPSITSSPLSYTAYEKLTGVMAKIPSNPTATATTVTLVANNVGIVPGSLVTGPAGTVGAGATVVKKVGLVLTLSVPNVGNTNPGAITAPLTFTPVHSFDVKAVGGALVYRWKRNGVVLANGPSPTGSGAVISGATTEVLTLTDMRALDAGSYSVTASNTLGTVTSKVATLNVIPFNQIMYPAITSSLVELILPKGVAMAPYQITTNTATTTTATASLAAPVLPSTDPGNYKVTLVAANPLIHIGMSVVGGPGTVGSGATVTDVSGTSVTLSAPNANAALVASTPLVFTNNPIISATASLAAPVLPSTDPSNFKIKLTAANASIVPGMAVSGGITGTIGIGATVLSKDPTDPTGRTLILSVSNTNAALVVSTPLVFYNPGTNPVTYAAKGLPSGVTCSSSGLISGKPTKSGTYLVTLQGKSKTGALASATLYMIVP